MEGVVSVWSEGVSVWSEGVSVWREGVSVWSEGVSVWRGWGLLCGVRELECYTHTIHLVSNID